MKQVVVLLALVFLAASVGASEKRLINVDTNGVALKGYDPVAYFTDSHAVKGNPQFTSTYNGATYQFASIQHKRIFDATPSKFEPQFGGYCAYAASLGRTASIDPEAFQIVNGRLLVQYSLGIRDKFNQDTLGNLKKADTNWPGLVEKHGK